MLKLPHHDKLITPAVVFGWAPWLVVLAVYAVLLVTASPWK